MTQRKVFYFLFLFFSYSSYGSLTERHLRQRKSPPPVDPALSNIINTLTAADPLKYLREGVVSLPLELRELPLGGGEVQVEVKVFIECGRCGLELESAAKAQSIGGHQCSKGTPYCPECFLAYIKEKILAGYSKISCPTCPGEYYSDESLMVFLTGRRLLLRKLQENIRRSPECFVCEERCPLLGDTYEMGDHHCAHSKGPICKDCFTTHVIAEIDRGRLRVACPQCKSAEDSFTEHGADRTMCYPVEAVRDYLKEVGTPKALAAKDANDHDHFVSLARREGWSPCSNGKCQAFLHLPGAGDVCKECGTGYIPIPAAEGARHCPHCRGPIEKTGGCDKLFCPLCAQDILWSECVDADGQLVEWALSRYIKKLIFGRRAHR